MRKSLWSPDEDAKLKTYVTEHGYGNWSDVAKHAGLQRCGKSCRLRWLNYLRPDLKRGKFCGEEIRLIVKLHKSLGNSWSKIAWCLPGRTDNDIKNFWHSYTRSTRRAPTNSMNMTSTYPSENPINNNNHHHINNNHHHHHHHIQSNPNLIVDHSSPISYPPNLMVDHYSSIDYPYSPPPLTNIPSNSSSTSPDKHTLCYHDTSDHMPLHVSFSTDCAQLQSIDSVHNKLMGIPYNAIALNPTFTEESSSIPSNLLVSHDPAQPPTSPSWHHHTTISTTTDEGLQSVIWNFMNRPFIPTSDENYEDGTS